VVAEPVLDADDRLFAVRGAYQDISAQHWTEVALAVTRDQLAHTEQRAHERNRLTLQLQHAIMPPDRTPLRAPGLDVAVRYRPAETEQLVGGDWYDAVVLSSGLVLLCVGDVAGHGIEAATSMVVLRNALRGLAVTGAGPGQLLSWLNIVAHHLTGGVTATAVCGIYDPRRRVLRWARAGHLPPVLVRDADAGPLPLIKGILLGAVPEATFEEDEVQLEVHDTLLMYTDGLIERRDRSVEVSLRQLLSAARTTSGTLDQQLDRLLTYSRSDTDDDTCIVGIRPRRQPGGVTACGALQLGLRQGGSFPSCLRMLVPRSRRCMHTGFGPVFPSYGRAAGSGTFPQGTQQRLQGRRDAVGRHPGLVQCPRAGGAAGVSEEGDAGPLCRRVVRG
jgi:serine phosphatase RsbU (regulator of sigma subunit)